MVACVEAVLGPLSVRVVSQQCQGGCGCTRMWPKNVHIQKWHELRTKPMLGLNVCEEFTVSYCILSSPCETAVNHLLAGDPLPY